LRATKFKSKKKGGPSETAKKDYLKPPPKEISRQTQIQSIQKNNRSALFKNASVIDQRVDWGFGSV
jgi:hypothetical protein